MPEGYMSRHFASQRRRACFGQVKPHDARHSFHVVCSQTNRQKQLLSFMSKFHCVLSPDEQHENIGTHCFVVFRHVFNEAKQTFGGTT